MRGINNIVINPASLEIAPKDKVKTDKRDSKKSAEQLAVGRLDGIYIPSKEEELRRLLSQNARTSDERTDWNVFYTTNAVESLNSVIRKAIRNRKIFPSD